MEMLNSALEQRLTPLGYTRRSGTIFVRELSLGVLGTIGYLTAHKTSSIKLFVGVQFERVEKLYDELMSPFRATPAKSTPECFPTCFRDLFELTQERSVDPDFRLKESSYLRVSTPTISRICAQILIDLRQYGTPYVDFNSSSGNAAATMAEMRGGGIGSTAYKLPIIYWILRRTDDAVRYMTYIAAQKYPIGPYQEYAAILAARINARPAPYQETSIDYSVTAPRAAP
jgi:hypothetical protein